MRALCTAPARTAPSGHRRGPAAAHAVARTAETAWKAKTPDEWPQERLQASPGWYSLHERVRDSELDQFRVVNNSNYSRYLEHCRHEFLLEMVRRPRPGPPTDRPPAPCPAARAPPDPRPGLPPRRWAWAATRSPRRGRRWR